MYLFIKFRLCYNEFMKKFLKRVLIVFYLSILPIYAVADAGIIPVPIKKNLSIEELGNKVGIAIGHYCDGLSAAQKKNKDAKTTEHFDNLLSCRLEALSFMTPKKQN